MPFDTLRLGDYALRNRGRERLGRKYVVNGKNLARLLPPCDLFSPFGMLDRDGEARFARQLLLKMPSELTSGRVPLYVCPCCSDLGCGTIAVRVVRDSDSYVWTDFAVEDFSSEPARTCAEGYEFHFEPEAYRSLFQPLT
jgi:hypothetical protein